MTIDNERMLESFRLKNFKAVVDSGEVKLTPLTAFIGNNGAGKSSLIEGLELLSSIGLYGLSQSMKNIGGLHNIWNQAVPHLTEKNRPKDEQPYLTNPLSWELKGKVFGGTFTTFVEIASEPGETGLFIKEKSYIEDLRDSYVMQRTRTEDVLIEEITDFGNKRTSSVNVDVEKLTQHQNILEFIKSWKVISLNPEKMKYPILSTSSELTKEGSNIGQYLFDIRKIDPGVIDGILETLQYILPYISDLTPSRANEAKSYYLQLSEGNFKLPGVLLSSGTLRLIALLALLRHPRPAPLIVIEEIENGLDPRTINLIVSEIRNLIESGKSQVIITTHSPYLLDLLDLSHIVLVERVDGQPTFTRPADQPTLQKWAKSYAPGELYIRDRLSVRD